MNRILFFRFLHQDCSPYYSVVEFCWQMKFCHDYHIVLDHCCLSELNVWIKFFNKKFNYTAFTPLNGVISLPNLSFGIWLGKTGRSAEVPNETCLEAEIESNLNYSIRLLTVPKGLTFFHSVKSFKQHFLNLETIFLI